MANVEIVLPGEALGHSTDFRAGPGAFLRNDGTVCAYLAGVKNVEAAASGSVDERPVVSVTNGRAVVLPEPGSIVLARVLRVTPRTAACEVVCVSGLATTRPFSAVVRQQDVRSTDVDRVVLADCFRAGDLIRAEVLSLGDSRSYYLSTANSAYGVVHGMSDSGHRLVAQSWSTMACSHTGAVEKRKVAKIVEHS